MGSGESPNPKVCPAIFSQVELLQMLDRVVELEAILDTCVRSEVIPPSIRNRYRVPVTPKQGQVMSHMIPPVPFYCEQVKKEVRVAGSKDSPSDHEIKELTCNSITSCGAKIGIPPCRAKEMLLKTTPAVRPLLSDIPGNT